MAHPANMTSMGRNGLDIITDTSSNTPTDKFEYWGAVMALDADAVMTTLATDGDYGDNLNGKTLPKGVIIPGIWTEIERASGGEVIAWRSEKD